ncbi:TolB family protein [Changchengzhania lutea]|uniref:TolB family protein n=1 Tax=Changchengzhania lutea TaxID=2049305 RepID=UPI00115E050C|nr:PD40 domain-containing protein [Changchengzhania lutea]
MKFLIVILSLLSCFLGGSQIEKYTCNNLKINDERPHYGLKYYQSNKVVYTSYLLNKKGKIKRVGGNPVLTIFTGLLSDSGEISNEELLDIDPKEDIAHITSATFSNDGKHLYLTTHYNANDKPKGRFKVTNFTIKVGEYIEGKGWTDFTVLPFCIPRYSYGHPAFSADGKTLYFIANIRDGKQTTKGKSDIFKVNVLEDNTFSKPENLGAKVNSYSREMFPFMGADHTLYFSSDRPNGFGGFDLYSSKMNPDGTFEKAKKMPQPINSVKDDISVVLNATNKSGYIASKRLKGKGDDDIYYVTFE